jgi:hypothetical protein
MVPLSYALCALTASLRESLHLRSEVVYCGGILIAYHGVVVALHGSSTVPCNSVVGPWSCARSSEQLHDIKIAGLDPAEVVIGSTGH